MSAMTSAYPRSRSSLLKQKGMGISAPLPPIRFFALVFSRGLNAALMNALEYGVNSITVGNLSLFGPLSGRYTSTASFTPSDISTRYVVFA